MNGVARAVGTCVFLLQSAAWASEPSAAILLQTSSGGPALSSAITKSLERNGFRVVPEGMAQGSLESLGLTTVVDEEEAERLREALAVDRLIAVSAREAPEASQVVRVQFVDRGGISRRFAAVDAATFVDVVLRLVEEAPQIAVPVPMPEPTATIAVQVQPAKPAHAKFGKAGTVEGTSLVGERARA